MPTLTPARKSVYALGNLSANSALSSLTLVYVSYFLLEVVGLRPALAGLVPLIGRVVDAVTDPMMGRISDHYRIRGERRRPYFLIASLPYALSFAMLWFRIDTDSQWLQFFYYAVAYSVMSTSLTVLVIPYLALVPEMAIDYDERTSLQTYLNAASILGIVVALAIRPMANAFDVGGDGFLRAGLVVGVGGAVCWMAVHRVSFERPGYASRAVLMSVGEGLRSAFAHRTFRQLTGLYLAGRISMDLVGTCLLPFFTYWIGRSEDFEFAMLAFLATVVVVLPAWLRFSRGRDKSQVFVYGSVIWLIMQLLLFVVQPDWPRWTLLAFTPLLAIGYAVVDLMPWAMVGDVIDEDDLITGERREGLYNGVFTFIRKLAGALAVFVALFVLDVAGLEKGAVQSEGALMAVRVVTSFGPALFLGLGIWFAWSYPLTRRRHREILSELAKRPTAQ